jgi:hypothetical protein
VTKVLPVLLPDSSLEEQASSLWIQSLSLSSQLDTERVLVHSKDGQGSRLIRISDDRTYLFRRVPDFIDLASFSQWCVPFSVFMRLACFHLYLDKVRSNCNKSLLKDPKNETALYWTYWLHSQGINHPEFFV